MTQQQDTTNNRAICHSSKTMRRQDINLFGTQDKPNLDRIEFYALSLCICLCCYGHYQYPSIHPFRIELRRDVWQEIEWNDVKGIIIIIIIIISTITYT